VVSSSSSYKRRPSIVVRAKSPRLGRTSPAVMVAYEGKGGKATVVIGTNVPKLGP